MPRGLTWRGREIKTHSRETEHGATEGGGLRTGRWPASRSERKRSLRNQGRCPDQRRAVLGPQEKQGDLRSPGEQRSGHAATAAWRGSPPRGPGPGARPPQPHQVRPRLAWQPCGREPPDACLTVFPCACNLGEPGCETEGHCEGLLLFPFNQVFRMDPGKLQH